VNKYICAQAQFGIFSSLLTDHLLGLPSDWLASGCAIGQEFKGSRRQQKGEAEKKLSEKASIMHWNEKGCFALI
jgi:hypothetical protein